MNDQTGATLLHGNAIKIASGPVVPPSGRTIDHAPLPRDPFRDLDRAIAAGLARMTGGLSPVALWLAYSDWAMHLPPPHASNWSSRLTCGRTGPGYPAKRCGRRPNVNPRHRLGTTDFAETPGNNFRSGSDARIFS
jgi:Poly-beta-hydroxybutyrate polymerase N terminal